MAIPVVETTATAARRTLCRPACVARARDEASPCLNSAGHLVTYSPASTAFCRPRPGLLSRFPAPNATNVPRDVHPALRFDQAVVGVSGSTVHLRDVASAHLVAAVVTYDASLHVARLVPSALLGVGRTYQVEVAETIKNAAGRAFWGTTWQFRVSTDGTAPTFTATPAANTTGVSRTTNVVLQFSEAVRGVSTRTLRLRDEVTGHYVADTVTYDAVRHRATLHPTSALAGGRRYRVVVTAGISDLAGNPRLPTSWVFRTRT